MITLHHYLVVSAVLFILGISGVLLRRNSLIVFMSLEMILNAANIAFVAFSRYNNNIDGQIFVFFTIAVAAAEVAVGLAIIVAIFRMKQTIQTSDLTSLKH